jgi:hypothetical protein
MKILRFISGLFLILGVGGLVYFFYAQLGSGEKVVEMKANDLSDEGEFINKTVYLAKEDNPYRISSRSKYRISDCRIGICEIFKYTFQVEDMDGNLILDKSSQITDSEDEDSSSSRKSLNKIVGDLEIDKSGDYEISYKVEESGEVKVDFVNFKVKSNVMNAPVWLAVVSFGLVFVGVVFFFILAKKVKGE